jgi:hypothetical protein
MLYRLCYYRQRGEALAAAAARGSALRLVLPKTLAFPIRFERSA